MDDADPAKCSTPGEFEGHELRFVRDLVPAGDHPPMPPDPAYPHRGMHAGGQGGATKSFSMAFRLPEGIAGEKVLLQWKYITANSVSDWCRCTALKSCFDVSFCFIAHHSVLTY